MKTWFTPGHVVILLVLAVGLFALWRDAQTQLDNAEKKITSLEAARKDELADLKTQLESIKHDQRTVRTPDQIAAKLPAYIPLPQPIVVTKTDASGSQSEPPSLTIPPSDVQPLFQFATDCAACKLQHEVDVEQITELKKERDAALKAAKGGGFWRRVGRAAEYLGIGVGIGAGLAKL